jgi:LPS sulfotransferase NodH
VIFTPGRCGSELLVELLSSQPTLECAGELLSERVPDPVRTLRAAAARSGRAGFGAFGCKVLVGQLTLVQKLEDPDQVLTELRRDGWMIIGLTRRHLLRQVLSWIWADETGRYHDRAGASERRGALTVAPEELISMLVAHEAAGATIDRALGRGDLRLVYEDDLLTEAAQEATVDRVTAALGIASVPTRARLRRSEPVPLRAALRNYDEIAAVLSLTRFAPLLEE